MTIEIGATYISKTGLDKVTVVRVTEKSIIFTSGNGESVRSHKRFAHFYPTKVSEFGEWEPTAETNLADRNI